MYRGFNLRLSTNDIPPKYSIKGLALYESNKASNRGEMDNFLLPGGAIDGKKLITHWFPEIEADVFISHSHCNKDLAIKLAGWLSSTLNIKAFIDSSVWGYANDLIRKIDVEYCYNLPEKKTFDYDLRNNSTAHVHIMLSTALNMMIDKTECLFFLNTPDSIKPIEAVNKNTTNSPWIYSEIATSTLLKKPLSEHLRRKKNLLESKMFSVMLNEAAAQLDVRFPLPIDELTVLDIDDLKNWQAMYNVAIPHPDYSLDTLYEHFKKQ